MNDKTGVFLTGNGARGAFDIGFFSAIEELDINYNKILGSSIGALIGGAATYMDAYEMFDLWKSINLSTISNIDEKRINSKRNQICTLKLWKELIKARINNQPLVNMDNTQRLLHQQISKKQILSSSIDFGVTVKDPSTNQLVTIFKNEMDENGILEYILKSIYSTFQNQTINSSKSVSPLNALIDCQTIYIVNTDYSSSKMSDLIRRANLQNNNIILINMDKKTSIFDFTTTQTFNNVKNGYENTIQALIKSKHI